ncbi:MAG: family transcriptional regulator, cyclic receptor protein [Acidobacteriota bacterium]|jgi:CRP/FNR family transcriptional regulator|nr:family transcriptional regulator, cyclic receptor protein [Acidobacteriota bacterium]
MPTPYNLKMEDHCTTCSHRGSRPFCDMAPAAVEALDASKYSSVYPKGSLLFVEGEQPRGVFMLCSGRAKLTTTSTEGRTLILKIAQGGELLGASAALLGRPYEVSAETLEPSQISFIRRDDFMRLLSSFPEACLHTAQALSEKYASAQREIRTLGLAQTTSEKLAKLILGWVPGGETTSEGTRLQILLTHEEIAQMIGTTRETVTRLLSDFKRKKLISVKGSNLFVLGQQRMQDMVSI